MRTLETYGNQKKRKFSEKKFSLCKGQKCIDKQIIAFCFLLFLM